MATQGIIAFIRKGNLAPVRNNNWVELYYQKGFVSFISPYFAVVFNNVIRNFLAQSDLNKAAAWFDYLKFVEPADEEEALRNTRIYLSDVARFFRNLNDQSYKSRDEELYLWYNTSWNVFINKLPDPLLPYVDEIISAMINFTVRIQNTDRKVCYSISKEMLLVQNTNYSLKQLIRSNHEAYRQNNGSKTPNGKRIKGGVNILYIILVVTFGIARIFMSNSSHREKNFDFSKNSEIGTYSPNNEVDTSSYQTAPVELSGSDNPDPAVIGDSEAEENNTVLESGNSIENIRSFFEIDYKKSIKTGTHPLSAQQLAKTAFAKKPVYFFIEGHTVKADSNMTIAIENTTHRPVNIDMLWSGAVYHHDMQPNSYIGFKASSEENVDFVVTFQSGNDQHFSANAATTQYVHLRTGNKKLPESIGGRYYALAEHPYLLHSQLKTSAIYVQIKEQNSQIYFEIQGSYKVYNSLVNGGK